MASYNILLSLIRSSIEDNHLYVSSSSNYRPNSYRIGSNRYLRFLPREYPTSDNRSCYCINSNHCMREQGFFCTSRTCSFSANQPNQTIPGFVTGCLPLNSFLLSTLQCLYNQSCIQMLLDWRQFELDGWFQPVHLNISALDSTISSRYQTNTSLNDIVSNIMIEEWIDTTDASAHYHKCKPTFCTYTYTTRYNFVQVITSLLGLISGFNLSLRLLIPFLVKLLTQSRSSNHQVIPETATANGKQNEFIHSS